MNSALAFEPQPIASHPLYPLLPLAIAGFTTFLIFGIQSFLGLVANRKEFSGTTNPYPKEHFHETHSQRPPA